MSEAVVPRPSYRVEREASSIPWRILGIAGGVLVVVGQVAGAFGGIFLIGLVTGGLLAMPKLRTVGSVMPAKGLPALSRITPGCRVTL
jgi:hypothetical protein